MVDAGPEPTYEEKIRVPAPGVLKTFLFLVINIGRIEREAIGQGCFELLLEGGHTGISKET